MILRSIAALGSQMPMKYGVKSTLPETGIDFLSDNTSR
jgi:hypothetical protein